MKYKIAFIGDKGTEYSFIDEYDDFDLTCGEWNYPFPNTKEESSAYGCYESLMQSDRCPFDFTTGKENVIKIIISEVINKK